jgi:hypothetical protein
MRSVHTLASVQAHRGGTSLPCLAFGTPGRGICSCVSFTPSPSCPPWLHGRYPLRSYYGDSDSCSASSSTRAGLLDSLTCTSGHSISNHPMRPRLPAILRVPGGLGHRFALPRYRQFFGLRSLLAVSSVASGRIEFVSLCLGHRCSTDYPFTSSCSPPRVATAQLLSVTRQEVPPMRDLHPRCRLTLKRTSRRRQSAQTSPSKQISAD